MFPLTPLEKAQFETMFLLTLCRKSTVWKKKKTNSINLL